IISFGEDDGCNVRLVKAVLSGSYSCIEADVLGEPVTYRLGAPGRHLVQNSLAVLAAVKQFGADLALAGLALAETSAPTGRGARTQLAHPRGGEITLIDEAYNTNPASMRSAIGVLGNTKPGRGGRRIAVLGDMLELGDDSEELHRSLASSIDEAAVDGVYACGPMMENLWEALPSTRKAIYAENSEGLEKPLLDGVQPGDIVMIKGSLGSKMLPLVVAMKQQFPECRDNEE
ncbi:MAG: glutamate ligase domain-containing protein, partial [Hyphomicrobiales bacterium]